MSDEKLIFDPANPTALLDGSEADIRTALDGADPKPEKAAIEAMIKAEDGGKTRKGVTAFLRSLIAETEDDVGDAMASSEVADPASVETAPVSEPDGAADASDPPPAAIETSLDALRAAYDAADPKPDVAMIDSMIDSLQQLRAEVAPPAPPVDAQAMAAPDVAPLDPTVPSPQLVAPAEAAAPADPINEAAPVAAEASRADLLDLDGFEPRHPEDIASAMREGPLSVVLTDGEREIAGLRRIEADAGDFDRVGGRWLYRRPVTVSGTDLVETLNVVALVKGDSEVLSICEIPGGAPLAGRNVELPAGSLIFG